jgi:hypothetical protein
MKNTVRKNKMANRSNKTLRKKNGRVFFADYPEFTPNLSPSDIFRLGSFGGTYWRPIYSKVTHKQYKNVHKKYKDWWKGIPESHLSSPTYANKVNKYNCKVGTTLEFWEGKHWITLYNPYGWVHCIIHMAGYIGIVISTGVDDVLMMKGKSSDGRL